MTRENYEVKSKSNSLSFLIVVLVAITVFSCSSQDSPSEPNIPPAVPSDPSPADGAISVIFNPALTWTCSDPNNDPLTYDIYFGDVSNPPLIVDDQQGAIYLLAGLQESSTYYWKISAKDAPGDSTAGPIWSFTTGALASDQISSFGSLPRWSPDGQKLLFGGEGISIGLWIYYRSSGIIEQITDGTYPHLWDYAWSPTSDKIAFGGAGSEPLSFSGIFVVALDGSDPVRWHSTGHSPCWKPDNSGLVFVENDPVSSEYGLWELDFADTSVAQLSESGIDPDFNPSGTRIAFREPTAANVYALNTMTAAGPPVWQLTNNCQTFVWTPDGSALVYDYLSYSEGLQIRLVPASGGSPDVITYYACQPSIATTERIAYQGVNLDLSLGIFVINLDGSDHRQLTIVGSQPSITPDGNLIAYTYDNSIWLVSP